MNFGDDNNGDVSISPYDRFVGVQQLAIITMDIKHSINSSIKQQKKQTLKFKIIFSKFQKTSTKTLDTKHDTLGGNQVESRPKTGTKKIGSLNQVHSDKVSGPSECVDPRL